MAFLRDLIANKESGVDSVIVGGLVALFVMCGLSMWDVIAAHHEFASLTFAGATTTIIGGIAGGKRWRDGVTDASPAQAQ
jgi:hypothetical protein